MMSRESSERAELGDGQQHLRRWPLRQRKRFATVAWLAAHHGGQVKAGAALRQVRQHLQRLTHRRMPPQEADGIDRRLGFGGRVPDMDSGAAIVEVTGGEGVEGVAAVIVPLHTQHVRPCANPQPTARIHLNSCDALRVWTAS